MIGLLASALLLLAQPAIPENEWLRIEFQGETAAQLQRSDITMPELGMPHINDLQLNIWINEVSRKLSLEPRNAVIEENGRIIAEQKGRRIMTEKLQSAVMDYYLGQGNRIVQAPVVTVNPKVDKQLLQLLSAKRIGYYVTYYKSFNVNRSHNIDLATKALNSYVVFPGETFSFNQAVGKRTVAKGYKPAKIIVRGEYSEGIGGGICQVSSTLFNAVDRAGLKIVNRYSHSREVPYVPPGRDATVSWGGPDFRFRNEYPYPILIRASSHHGQMLVTIYSFTELEYEPRMVPSASKVIPEEEEIELSGEIRNTVE
ncbi:VanW family protein [Brevibacillus sp. SYSU BS000544]|uniref:VanW family protein n=1 Tax=Brevibacillus sp. SYSU BS000544 TaxID=3416443 RepID=UPI003CE56AB5